jgi:hypothetical protein
MNELGFALGHANDGDHPHLRVVLDGAVEEFELPIGPAADVKNAKRLLAAIHRHNLAVVGQGRLARFGAAPPNSSRARVSTS